MRIEKMNISSREVGRLEGLEKTRLKMAIMRPEIATKPKASRKDSNVR